MRAKSGEESQVDARELQPEGPDHHRGGRQRWSELLEAIAELTKGINEDDIYLETKSIENFLLVIIKSSVVLQLL